jgi:pre-mRNA-splicing helicase BRR2
MDPEENPNYNQLIKSLGLSQTQLAQAAQFTNSKYPNMDLAFDVEDPEEITAGVPAYLNVKITREVDEDEDLDTTVHAPFYPVKKMENWWLVVGDESSKTLLAIKRITIGTYKISCCEASDYLGLEILLHTMSEISEDLILHTCALVL